MLPSKNNNIIVLCSIILGTALEWYDFALIGLLAPIISTQFFPSNSPTLSLLYAFCVFAIGFIARPLGGIFFGHIGDRRGRQYSLSFTILLMAFLSTLIGCLPTEKTLGVSASILLIVLRLLQGLASSGEYPGAICYLTEIAPAHKRGLYGSFSMLGVAGGLSLASLITAYISAKLTPPQWSAWGWRIPFLLGTPLGLIGWYLRVKAKESAVFARSKPLSKSAIPLIELMRTKSGDVLKLILFFALSTISFYLGSIYITTVLINNKTISFQQALMDNTFSTLTLIILIPIFGYFSDKFNRQKVMLVGVISLSIFFYPIFILFTADHARFLLLGQLLLMVLIAIFTGPLSAVAAEIFSTPTRYTGIALGLNIGASLFGSTCPMIATYIVYLTHNETLPSLYPIFIGILCLGAVCYLKNKASLEEESNPF